MKHFFPDFHLYTERQYAKQSGQVALIAMLVMAVVLGVGVSVANRSVQDIALSRQEQNSSSTFQSAETVLEEALSQADSFSNDAVSGSVDGYGEYAITPQLEKLDFSLLEGESVMIPLAVPVDSAGTLVLEWNQKNPPEGGAQQASLLITRYFYSATSNTYWSKTAAYNGRDCDPEDPSDPTCFEASGEDISADGNSAFTRRLEFSPGNSSTSEERVFSVRALSSDTNIRVSGTALGSDAVQWSVVAKAENTDGDEKKAIQVIRSLPMPLSFLEFSMISGTDIVKTTP
ncbi:MAG: hypothetical protein UX04_C0003G0035 [Microgenomates group bacterium GW2011_GWF2_45_18]|nr:MAG: hypothetical protein UW18_C0002G0035 [Microgenomates group bacterium GW2011_GWF1_44_10]KKU01763.1 MAG: hypothetical protein UX04_C0003G0035 [Microgenomates group bacterium GW2011_GWF2_45_18]OGJ41478.1 MAG: hypothetical protein A2378_04360 [Candidatus Pacebacteria bacterium RIFOXYB1_FULL_44_10]HAU98933.1 hypothetical protein [Candidatus Paceibacterota bacterium]HAX01110.1 hypothetical protein [Candidatus Paceibacterota bacterium]